MRFLIAIGLLVLAPSATALPLPTNSAGFTSCGSTDGGAFHLTVASADHFLVIHADDNNDAMVWEKPTPGMTVERLKLMVCAPDASGCAPAATGRLSIKTTGQSYSGHVSYQFNGSHFEADFRGQFLPVPPGRICG